MEQGMQCKHNTDVHTCEPCQRTYQEFEKIVATYDFENDEVGMGKDLPTIKPSHDAVRSKGTILEIFPPMKEEPLNIQDIENKALELGWNKETFQNIIKKLKKDGHIIERKLGYWQRF